MARSRGPDDPRDDGKDKTSKVARASSKARTMRSSGWTRTATDSSRRGRALNAGGRNVERRNRPPMPCSDRLRSPYHGRGFLVIIGRVAIACAAAQADERASPPAEHRLEHVPRSRGLGADARDTFTTRRRTARRRAAMSPREDLVAEQLLADAEQPSGIASGRPADRTSAISLYACSTRTSSCVAMRLAYAGEKRAEIALVARADLLLVLIRHVRRLAIDALQRRRRCLVPSAAASASVRCRIRWITAPTGSPPSGRAHHRQRLVV